MPSEQIRQNVSPLVTHSGLHGSRIDFLHDFDSKFDCARVVIVELDEEIP